MGAGPVNPIEDLHHRDGVPWALAPLPRRWHLCQVWSWGLTYYGTPYAYCACGARRVGLAGWWKDKNRRRKLQDAKA